jgi:hypothetical protein
MSMRIMWAGPWDERSAIAEFGSQVVEQLVLRGHAVDVLRTEVGRCAALPARPAPSAVRFWGDVSIHELRRDADAVIVNFADDYQFQGGMLHNVADAGVVGIFHDRCLANLAAGYASTWPDPYAKLRYMVEATYGPHAWRKGEPFLADLETLSGTRPMLEWFAAGVCGAVVHDGNDADVARAACPGPVEVIPIPLPLEGVDAAARYVDLLLPLVDAAVANRPTVLTGQALGRTLASFGLAPDDPSVNRVGAALSGMLGNARRGL